MPLTDAITTNISSLFSSATERRRFLSFRVVLFVQLRLDVACLTSQRKKNVHEKESKDKC